MEKICIIIRVYNRIEDLKYCLAIIRETWSSYEYFIIITANGRSDGYVIDQATIDLADSVIETRHNIGHFSGNSQLLLAATPHIPQDCAFTIILESDTWLYGDELIKEYIQRLTKEGAVWASAQFFRYVLNLATDFAILKTQLIKDMPELFEFTHTPEYYIGELLTSKGLKYLYIKELMPVNLPRYVKKYPFAPTGRFFAFAQGKMVTHHIELLKEGMAEKKFYFNVVSGERYFDVPDRYPAWLTLLSSKFFSGLSALVPYKGWFIKRKKISVL